MAGVPHHDLTTAIDNYVEKLTVARCTRRVTVSDVREISKNAKSNNVGFRYRLVLPAQERQAPALDGCAGHQASQRETSEVDGMKFAIARPYADPEAAARKLTEIANSV
jgi:hypothetical protein